MSKRGNVESATRTKILEAVSTVLTRYGYSRLNLSDVAAQAGISRPTLYKFFPSKEELLEAFGQYERQMVSEAMAAATAGLVGEQRLDAALRFMADFYHSQRLRRMVELEPDLVLLEMSRALPELRTLLEPFLEPFVSDPEVAATTVARIAMCHYLVPGYDDDRILDQLRRAAGLDSR
jgi:AcrR family transcriptional regulator